MTDTPMTERFQTWCDRHPLLFTLLFLALLMIPLVGLWMRCPQ